MIMSQNCHEGEYVTRGNFIKSVVLTHDCTWELPGQFLKITDCGVLRGTRVSDLVSLGCCSGIRSPPSDLLC